MTDPDPRQTRLDPIRCPHCDDVTMPNRLADGSLVCSCPAERPLPGDGAGGAAGMAAVPDTGRDPLPPDAGQFGRDVETEDYGRLRPPPRG